jgi:hypothetical protein
VTNSSLQVAIGDLLYNLVNKLKAYVNPSSRMHAVYMIITLYDYCMLKNYYYNVNKFIANLKSVF